VGRQDLDIDAWGIPQCLADRHRNRVRLFTRRTACGPDPQPVTGLRLRERREYILPEVFEVMRLPEKGREVSGDGIAELDHLLTVRLALQQLAILRERIQPQHPQSAGESSVNEIPLTFRKADAGDAMNQCPQCGEIFVTESKLTRAM